MRKGFAVAINCSYKRLTGEASMDMTFSTRSKTLPTTNGNLQAPMELSSRMSRQFASKRMAR